MPTRPAAYRRIADAIAAAIRSGDLAPGDRLPSTSELAKQHGVSTSTAYRAMSLLHDRDLVVGEPGRAVFVAEA
jgi:GntR family transcriptional regulator